jgi:hypothetical protein
MSWHFSQALAAEYSAASCSDGEPSAPWKSIPSAPDDSCSAKMKATCHRSPFGMMFVPSMDAHGQELLTSFLAASRARTSAQPGRARESTVIARDCGRSSLASLAKYDPDTCSWRTPQCSLVAGLDVFSEAWPRWGMMLSGECWELAMLEPHTRDAESGWLPTLTVHGNYNRKGASPHAGDGLGTALAKLPTLPTLCSRDYRTGKRLKTKGGQCLSEAIDANGGPLNPDWCEWFMGWPIGWTASAPLGTAKFRQWCDSHGRR